MGFDEPSHGLFCIARPGSGSQRRACCLQPEAIGPLPCRDKGHNRKLEGTPVDAFEQDQMCSIDERLIPVVRTAPTHNHPEIGPTNEAIDLAARYHIDVGARWS